MVVPVETESTFEPGNPKILFEGQYGDLEFQGYPFTFWDIHPNGKKFLMMKPPAATTAESIEEEGAAIPRPKIIVVVNWFEELKERVRVE